MEIELSKEVLFFVLFNSIPQNAGKEDSVKAITVIFLMLFSGAALAFSECNVGADPENSQRFAEDGHVPVLVPEGTVIRYGSGSGEVVECTTPFDLTGWGDPADRNSKGSVRVVWIERCGNTVHSNLYLPPLRPTQASDSSATPQLVFYNMGPTATTAQAGLNVNLRNANRVAGAVAAAAAIGWGLSETGWTRIKTIRRIGDSSPPPDGGPGDPPGGGGPKDPPG